MARNDVPFLFKAFESGQARPPRPGTKKAEEPRSATIHEYLDWTVTSNDSDQVGLCYLLCEAWLGAPGPLLGEVCMRVLCSTAALSHDCQEPLPCRGNGRSSFSENPARK